MAVKYLLIAVYLLYPKGETPYVERVEVLGSFKTLAACQKETNIPFGLIPPGMGYIGCVPDKPKKQ